ncbi:hypothetical protein [Bradyrhizobium sp. B120]|uniref:hypothetical protein n=1 Tax=Bradyrhizobium sp. B120 TaxID=3410088 RepID=UPI003B984A9A
MSNDEVQSPGYRPVEPDLKLRSSANVQDAAGSTHESDDGREYSVWQYIASLLIVAAVLSQHFLFAAYVASNRMPLATGPTGVTVVAHSFPGICHRTEFFNDICDLNYKIGSYFGYMPPPMEFVRQNGTTVALPRTR